MIEERVLKQTGYIGVATIGALSKKKKKKNVMISECDS